MRNDEIKAIMDSLALGDKLAINDWKAKYTVCGLSENYALAHYGQHYTILQRKPMPDDYCFNGVRGGDYRCAPDWWIFGYVDGYDFTSKKWVTKYMAELESGDTEMSQKRHATIYFLSVVGHVDNIYRKHEII